MPRQWFTMLFVRASWISWGVRGDVASLGIMSESSSGPGPRGKVNQLLEKYDLEGFGDYLVDRWTREDASERLSLRALAREFNIRLLEARLTEANSGPIEGTAEGYYESLSGENVSSGVRTEARRSLEQAGVDVDGLEAELVSRQAIHTYLTKTRGVNKPTGDSSISGSAVQETIDRLRERVRLVTTSRLERLRNAGELTLGEFRVVTDVQVYCRDCGTQQGLSGLLAAKGCDCSE